MSSVQQEPNRHASGLELPDLVQVDGADIFDGGDLIARLRYTGGSTTFSYDASWRAALGRPASLSLPIDGPDVVRPGRGVPAAFAGLLPEGRRLTATKAALKTSADDELSLLLAVGHDVVGHLQIVPPGERPTTNVPEHKRGPIDGNPVALDLPGALGAFGARGDSTFAALFDRSIGAHLDLVGLAGAQNKVSGAMINLPLKRANNSYLLKLNPPEFPFLVENESFFLQAARDCHVEAAETTLIHDSVDAAGLLVSRFDRATIPSDAQSAVTARLACEDGCQILGVFPSDKYRVDTAELVRSMASRTGAPAVAAASLFRLLVVAVVSGNGDAHAKNFSLLQRQSDDGPRAEWSVSPAYDMPSTYPYGDSTLALPFGGRRGVRQVSRRQILDFAEQIGVRQRAASAILDDVTNRFEPWIERIEELPFDADRLLKLKRFLTSRHRLLVG